MTARGEDILAFLDAAISLHEERARALGGGPIKVKSYGSGAVQLEGAIHLDGDALHEDEVAHIVLNDPESVLRRCAADRKAVGLYAETVSIRDTAAVTIQSAQERGVRPDPCVLDDWSRANREAAFMLPLIQILAEGYGWTEGER